MHLNTKNNSTCINTRLQCTRIVSPFYFPETYLNPRFSFINSTDWYTKDLRNIANSIYMQLLLDGKNEYSSYKIWDGSDIICPDRVGNIFVYTWNLGSSLSCKPIYNICYLHMRVGQRGGGHSCITEFAGHIIHQSTWHTVFRGELLKIWQKWRYSSLLQQYKPRFSCTWQTLPVWKHNGRELLLLCIHTASAPLTLAVWSVRTELTYCLLPTLNWNKTTL